MGLFRKYGKAIEPYIEAGGSINDKINVHINAPVKYMERGIKLALSNWNRITPERSARILRPTKEVPWLIEYSGNDVTVEWIKEDRIDIINNSLTSFGFDKK